MYLSREEFFQLRIQRVKENASLYDALEDMGHTPRFEDRASQMPCCFMSSHSKGKDNKPSARYYPAGERDDYETYYCWVCTDRPLDVIGFHQRVQGVKFGEALRLLERKYGIRYDDVEVAKDISKELSALSKASRKADPKRVLRGCEDYLRRNRDRYSMDQYVKLGYFLDRIHHSFDETKPEQTLLRASKWKDKARQVAKKGEANAG